MILFFARAKRGLGHLARRDVARKRQDAIASADGHVLDEHFVPAQRAVLALAVPLDALRLAGERARNQRHGVLLDVGRFAASQVTDLDAAKLLTGVAERRAGLEVDVDDRPRFVVEEDGILRRVEDRPVAELGAAQRLVRPLALRDVGGDAAHSIGGAARVMQREFDRDLRVQPVGQRCRLLELHRHVSLEHELVVGAKDARRVRVEPFAFFVPDDVAIIERKHALPFLVDE